MKCLVQDLNEEAFEVSAALGIQSLFQGHIVLLQVHVLHRLQINLRCHHKTFLVLKLTCCKVHFTFFGVICVVQLFTAVCTHTCLRASYYDANERVLIGAHSLHGRVEAPGKIKLWVLSTPHYKSVTYSIIR